eukprot:jgi/Picre1/27760/NNA_000724.t1
MLPPLFAECGYLRLFSSMGKSLQRVVRASVERPIFDDHECFRIQNTGIGVKEEKVSEATIKLEVTVPARMCQAAYRSTLKEWNDKIACTGFRKGKAPDNVLIEQLGGKKRVYATVLANLIENVMGPALEKAPSSCLLFLIVRRFSSLERNWKRASTRLKI